MSKRHVFTDHQQKQFTRTLKMSKATACLLIMLGIQPYPFAVAIPDESKTENSHVGPVGYGRDPASLLRPGGRLSLKSDLSIKYGIRGAGGETVPDFKDEPGMDESIDEFDTEFNREGGGAGWGSDPSSVCSLDMTRGGGGKMILNFEDELDESIKKLTSEFDMEGGSATWGSDPGYGKSICGIDETKFVKVSLPGRGNVVSLAEVQVFTMVDGSEKNVALSSEGANAKQSSTCENGENDFNANKAIDGNTEGSAEDVTHTNQERDPYWEVELSAPYSITRIVVWNRQEHNDWLSQATVELLDADRNVQATFQLPKEPENQGEGSKGPSFTFILPQSCTLVEGTYQAESNSATRPWWAFKPASCPSTGCPLFFWIDGTGEVDFREERQQQWMTEMFNRGYVVATVDYASNILQFGGCHGTPLDDNVGVVDKAEQMFDKDNDNSVINQLCNKPYVNCDGVAVAGFSQGSQIAALASDFDDRVSAALLLGSGDDVDQYGVVQARQHCMDTIKLPKQRRRYFSGDNDALFFNGDYVRGRQQLIRMSHYNCTARGAPNSPDSCLQHQPPSTADPYTGGTIDNTGGYYIVPNGAHGQFMDWSNFTGTLVDFNKNMHLDWLDHTARMTKSPLEQEPTSVALTVETGDASRSSFPHGVFFEWAANVNETGVLGRRHVVARDTSSDTVDFSHVPQDVIGFRLSARTHNAGMIARLDAKTNDGEIFKRLSFQEDGNDAFCFSVVPERDWDNCLGGKSHLCIDFCTDGNWYDCTTSFMVDGESEEESEEFSKCPLSTEIEDKIGIIQEID